MMEGGEEGGIESILWGAWGGEASKSRPFGVKKDLWMNSFVSKVAGYKSVSLQY